MTARYQASGGEIDPAALPFNKRISLQAGGWARMAIGLDSADHVNFVGEAMGIFVDAYRAAPDPLAWGREIAAAAWAGSGGGPPRVRNPSNFSSYWR